ncbi:MAG TPA: hypothetical protein VOB72_14545 [Candidatus Dormibacteraeota bacterium]|nr:hypothetical protein [Candidatus Dormibacteraeota bacterium]
MTVGSSASAGRSVVDVAVPLLVTAVQLGSAYVVLGTPDLAAARDFLTGSTPTMAGSLAAGQVVLWAMLAAAFGAALVTALTRTAGAVWTAAGGGALWAVTVVMVGLLILGAGVNHRTAAGSVNLSGGSVAEARAQLGSP